MRHFYTLAILLICTSCISIKADVTTTERSYSEDSTYNSAETSIRLVLEAQELAWNKHDLEGFMEGYWKSDQLKFYGASGLTLGWQQTLANYKSRYPTSAESGILNFVIKDISKIEGDNYWVMGKYHLKRDIGDADGIFIIIFKKIDDSWKIIADMSC